MEPNPKGDDHFFNLSAKSRRYLRGFVSPGPAYDKVEIQYVDFEPEVSGLATKDASLVSGKTQLDASTEITRSPATAKRLFEPNLELDCHTALSMPFESVQHRRNQESKPSVGQLYSQRQIFDSEPGRWSPSVPGNSLVNQDCLPQESLGIARQPETRPVPQEPLIAEVKEIYTGPAMVQGKWIELDDIAHEFSTEILPKPDSNIRLIPANGTLSHESTKFFGNQKSSATTANTRRVPPRTFRPQRANKRKVLRALVDGNEHLACPDSGSEKNIISQELANKLNTSIRKGPKDIKRFELGNGKCVFSVGRVRVPVKLLGSSLGRKKRWFYVLRNCPVPLILGMPFLQEAEVLTRNRHLLEACPQELSNISSLLWIGSPRQQMKCSMDGRNLIVVADTGSDLNLMSLNCAKREGFHIDRRREARLRIKVGDGTEAETIGQVHVHNLGLDWREAETGLSDGLPPIIDHNLPFTPDSESFPEDPSSFGAIFHVLPGLPCDLIFGHDLLEDTDAFNQCPELLAPHAADQNSPLELKIYLYVGPVLRFYHSVFKKHKSFAPELTAEQLHDREHSEEMYGRSKCRAALLAMSPDERSYAEAAERQRAGRYDRLHAACVYCHPFDAC